MAFDRVPVSIRAHAWAGSRATSTSTSTSGSPSHLPSYFNSESEQSRAGRRTRACVRAWVVLSYVRAYVLSAVITLTPATRSPPHRLNTVLCYLSESMLDNALPPSTPVSTPRPEPGTLSLHTDSELRLASTSRTYAAARLHRYTGHGTRDTGHGTRLSMYVRHPCAPFPLPFPFPFATITLTFLNPQERRRGCSVLLALMQHPCGEPRGHGTKHRDDRKQTHPGRSALDGLHIAQSTTSAGARTSGDVPPVLVSDAYLSTFL